VTNHVRKKHTAIRPDPPLNALFFLHLFLPPDMCYGLVGDLDQRFRKLVGQIGTARARWWYRKQVFTSLWPLFCAAVRRGGRSTVLSLVGFGLRLFGQGAVADELKSALGKRHREGV